MRPLLSGLLVGARRLAILAVLVGVLVRPTWGYTTADAQRVDAELLVVIDRTRSMVALDHEDGDPRLAGVRRDLVALARELPGAHLGLITFGGEIVRTELPFTTDGSAFETLVETLRVEGAYHGSGSRVDRPVPEMEEVLERAEEQHPDRRRFVVFVSDGENTVEGERESFADLAEYVDGGVVLGYGTDEGGRMPIDDVDAEDPGQGYVTDPETFEDAVSRIDEDNLRAVADDLGLAYRHRSDPQRAPMGEIADELRAHQVAADDDASNRREITWAVGLVLLGLLLWELRAGWRLLLRAREVGP